MRLATLSSCSMRSRSLISCSRRCFLSVPPIVPMPHSSAILPSTMRWTTIALLVSSPPVGATPISSPPIVDRVHDEAGRYLIGPCYLVLDDQGARGEGGMKGSDPPQVILAIGFLAGN